MEEIVDMTATQSNKPPVKAGLLDRLKSGLVPLHTDYDSLAVSG